ncbi:MAG TPA: hypothetical protein VLK25_09675, partial [Allosphingosinicella sp.]|nr:hypothetical protein [Allosphingosinicella sp.]
MKLVLGIALASGLAPAMQPAPAQEPPIIVADTRIRIERTQVGDEAALARLRRNSGITLQWISFEAPARGHVL